MNRLTDYMKKKSQYSASEVFGEDIIYKKVINNACLGSKKKQFKIKFIKTKDFFEKLNELGLRKSSQKHPNLVEFLSIDSNVYKRGLVVKKLDKLIKEFSEN